MNRLLVFLVLCAAAAAAAAAPPAEGGKGKGAAGGKPAGPPPAPVTVAPAVRKPLPFELQTFGTVTEHSVVEVRSQAGGVLTEAHFTEGTNVRAGELLFTIDPRPATAALQQAEANLARTKVQAAHAQQEAERQQQLLAKGLAAQDDYDQARTGAEALAASVRADEAAAANAKLQLEYCSIRAPISGRTGELLVQPGNLVRANDAILTTIRQLQPIYVDFSVSERELPAIQKSVAVAPPALRVFAPTTPDAVETGRLVFVDNTVDRATGTIRLRGEFENASQRLWPGQFLQVVLVRERPPEVLVVPTRAVQAGQKGIYVFVLKADGTVEQRPVQVERASGEETVVAEGLREGERVVTDGQLRLVPGGRAQVQGAAAVPEQKPVP